MEQPPKCPFAGLTAFRDVFGEPGKGFHSVRVLDIAILDVVGTLMGAWLIAQATGWFFGWVFVWLFVIGEILHVAFCVETTVVQWLALLAKNVLKL